MYIFIDPGEKRIGWAKYRLDGELHDMGTIYGFENLVSWMQVNINRKIDIVKNVVVEDFKLYPWKSQAQMWSQFGTVQVIGAIRAHCLLQAITYETVPAKNYPMGFQYLGMEAPPHSNPNHDQLVAMAHGAYWLQIHGIRKPQQGRTV